MISTNINIDGENVVNYYIQASGCGGGNEVKTHSRIDVFFNGYKKKKFPNSTSHLSLLLLSLPLTLIFFKYILKLFGNVNIFLIYLRIFWEHQMI